MLLKIDNKIMEEKSNKREFLGVLFECCNVYGRIYKSKDGSCYRGMCPKCMKSVTIKVQQGGSSERFFRSY